MSTRKFKLNVSLVIGFLFLYMVVGWVSCGQAMATDRSYAPVIGDWGDDSKWSGGQPTASDDAYLYGHIPNVTVTQSGEVARDVYLGGNSENDTGYLNINDYITNDGSLDVNSIRLGYGSASNAKGRVVVNGGTLTAVDGIYLGNGGSTRGFVYQDDGIVTTSSVNFNGYDGTYRLRGGTLNASSFTSAIGSSDMLEISGGTLSGDYTTINVSKFAVGEMGGNPGNYALEGQTINANFVYIGTSGSPGGTFTHNAGINNASTLLYIGNGVYTLNGGVLNVSSIVNLSGTGTLSIDGGTIGGTHSSIAVDNLNIGGATSTVGNYTHTAGKTLTATNEYIDNSGTGTLTQSGGTNTATTLYLGQNSGSQGTYALNGGTLSVGAGNIVNGAGASTLSINGGTLSGAYTSIDVDSFKLGYSGTGNFTLNTGKTLTAVNEYIGYATGSNGTFTHTGGTNNVTNLYMGTESGSTGTYLLNGGILNVANVIYGAGAYNLQLNGGQFNLSGAVSHDLGSANVNLDGGALSGNVTAGSFNIGSTGAVNYTQTAGETYTATNNFTLGSIGNSASTFTASGTVTAATGVQVNNGTFDLRSGSTLDAPSIARADGGYAKLSLNGGGIGTSVTSINVDDFILGESASSTYSLGAGKTLTATTQTVGDSNTGSYTHDGGTATVGTLNIGKNSGSEGTFTLASGQYNADEIVLGAGTHNFSMTGGILKIGSGGIHSDTLTSLGTIMGTIKGNGAFTKVNVTIGEGATLAPGNSPGTTTVDAATQTWASGGTFQLQILNAEGTAGQSNGWDLVNLINNGALDITATSGNKFNISIQGLTGISPDVLGDPSNFNASQNYSWKFVDGSAAGSNITGFNANKFTLSVSGFTGNAAYVAGYSISSSGGNLYLNYDASAAAAAAAAPEPATMVSLGLGLIGFGLRRFRRKIRA